MDYLTGAVILLATLQILSLWRTLDMAKKAEEVQADVQGLIDSVNTLIDSIGPAVSAAVATALANQPTPAADAVLAAVDDAVLAETEKVKAALAGLTPAPTAPPAPAAGSNLDADGNIIDASKDADGNPV